MTTITSTQLRTLLPWELAMDDPLSASFLSQDICDIIFAIIASTNTTSKSIVAFGSVNRGFRARYLSPCLFFPMMNALSCIYKSMPVASEPIMSPLRHVDQRFLAADKSGNQYYCSCWSYQSVLYIINPLHRRLITLDMDKPTPIDPERIESKIVGCHPIENGFILVCDSEISQWHFTNDTPEPVLAWRTIPPDQLLIRTSSLWSGKLLLGGGLSLHMLDLTDPLLPVWEVWPVDALVGKRCKYLNFNNQTYAFAEKNFKQLSTVVQLTDIKSSEDQNQYWRMDGHELPSHHCHIPGRITVKNSEPQLTPMGKYLIQPDKGNGNIFILDQNLKICCDADMQITYPSAQRLSDTSKMPLSGMIF